MPDPLSRATVAGMLARIAPGWTLRGRERLPAGHHHTERLTVGTATGRRDCVLKAAPAGESTGLGLETRLLAVLGDCTTVPVPGVHGVVDENDDYPSPFALFEAVEGRNVHSTDVGGLDPDTLERLARSVGRHLAALHDPDAVDGFGFLGHRDATRDGSRPPGDPAVVTVEEPARSWPALLRSWADDRLETLSTGRFADLVPEARPAIHGRIDALEGPFEPVLAHIDCSIDNVLFEADVTAMLDWAFTLAAPPAYDLVFVERGLAGGLWWYAPPAPDRRAAVSDALREGYAGASGRPAAQRTHGRETCELFACLNAMTLLEGWYEQVGIGEHADPAAEALRREFDRLA